MPLSASEKISGVLESEIAKYLGKFYGLNKIIWNLLVCVYLFCEFNNDFFFLHETRSVDSDDDDYTRMPTTTTLVERICMINE